PAGVVRGGGVVGDRDVLHPQLLGPPRHLLDAVLAVRVVRVTVDEAADVRLLQQVLGQRAGRRRLHLALVLPQLGGYVLQAEPPVERGLVGQRDGAAAPPRRERALGEDEALGLPPGLQLFVV